ncbi:hypothetical protein QJS04_geneDACA013391 [Acorus gramineus]|uniref:Uncharacterized protein n=1 Tax=Acorus gramineus TaxID=55184 RepID=A0AAV9A7R8_ACOGR|nr:hypothetical protein QJS04_geneDACA013391 [Acorus gramineus]
MDHHTNPLKEGVDEQEEKIIRPYQEEKTREPHWRTGMTKEDRDNYGSGTGRRRRRWHGDDDEFSTGRSNRVFYEGEKGKTQ